MQLSRARRLSLASTIHHGASGMLVRSSISSLAFVYCSQRTRDSRSIGLSFHCFIGSWMRAKNRSCCSSSLIENQYFTSLTPERTNMRSSSTTSWKKSSTCSGDAKPITRSTPARLYQERSKSTISPAAGRCAT